MRENLLLTNLPPEEREHLNPFLKPVQLEFAQELIAPEEPIPYLYFPINMVSSTIQEMSDGTSVEVGLMGLEGLIGIQVWLRQRTTPTRTLVQVPGHALQMETDVFIREVVEKPGCRLNHLLAAYVHAFLVMTSQTSACNRLHTIDQRLCRWILLTHNRAQRHVFPLTQEFIAQMLGVHRPTVSTAAKILQEAGLIDHRRGMLSVLDRQGLEAGTCECYRLMETQFNKIFAQAWPQISESPPPA